MNEKTKDESETTAEVVIGPGAQLRKARERQGLDQAKMAAQLHLSQTMIVALESDDFNSLPSPVFVQGYLRKYSRLLGVNEDAVVDAYQGLLPAPDEAMIRGAQKQELGRELHSGHGVVRYVTWGIVLILAALVFFWWQTRVDLVEPTPLPAQERQDTDVRDPQPAQVMPQPIPAEEQVSQPESASQEVVEESEQVLSEIDELLSTSDQEQTTDQQQIMADDNLQQPIESVQPDPVTTPAQVAESTESVESTEEVAPAVYKRVVFLFKESCWAEVRDRDGKLRIFGELGSDKRHTLDGRLGPFSVLLGNAPGVELTIDGESFDLKPFTRGKVARFTLDPNRL
jgi:cytoskeleton protein RodZ